MKVDREETMEHITENPTEQKVTDIATTETEVTLGFMGLGGFGTNSVYRAMRAMNPEDNKHLYFLVANTDHAQLKKYFEVKVTGEDTRSKNLRGWLALKDDRFFIVKLGKGLGAGGKPEKGAEISSGCKDQLNNFIDKVKLIKIFIGAGKGTGSGAGPVVAKTVTEKQDRIGRPPMVFMTMPRLNEGRPRLKKARDTYDKLIKICPTVVFYNENAPDSDELPDVLWDHIDGVSIVPFLLGLREIILEVGNPNLDSEDLWSMLLAGNYIQYGMSHMGVDHGGDIQAIVHELLNNPYQDCKIALKAKRMLLWFHGTWTVKEQNQIISGIQKEVGIENPQDMDIEIDISTHRGTDGKKWVLFMAAAAEAPGEIPQTQNSVLSIEENKHIPVVPEHSNGHGVVTGYQQPKLVRYSFNSNGDQRFAQIPEELAKRMDKVFSSRMSMRDRDFIEATLKEFNKYSEKPADPPSWLLGDRLKLQAEVRR